MFGKLLDLFHKIDGYTPSSYLATIIVILLIFGAIIFTYG